MKRLWLYCFPLLFLPNLGFARRTPFGTLELTDMLMGPYLVCLAFAPRAAGRLNVERVVPLFCFFVSWALFGTLSIGVRYDYGGSTAVVWFGLLKLFKLSLYAAAGFITPELCTARGGLTAG